MLPKIDPLLPSRMTQVARQKMRNHHHEDRDPAPAIERGNASIRLRIGGSVHCLRLNALSKCSAAFIL